jgi:hypothetical protein
MEKNEERYKNILKTNEITLHKKFKKVHMLRKKIVSMYIEVLKLCPSL